MNTKRLYVITRRDLGRGLKIAQACHVALESPKELPIGKDVPRLIVLEVEDEERLGIILEQATRKTNVVCFREPDLGNQLTAVAFLGDSETQTLTRRLRLAG